MSDYGYRADNQLGTGFKSQESILATNKVLKNTYLLLSMTLLFSAATAAHFHGHESFPRVPP